MTNIPDSTHNFEYFKYSIKIICDMKLHENPSTLKHYYLYQQNLLFQVDFKKFHFPQTNANWL